MTEIKEFDRIVLSQDVPFNDGTKWEKGRAGEVRFVVNGGTGFRVRFDGEDVLQTVYSGECELEIAAK